MRKTVSPSLHSLLKRGVVEIIREEELVNLLKTGESLRLKQGFDPSRPDIHLGHGVGLRKLRQFQELGHQVILIVGDWTAQIGDPSGESATRTMLSAAQVRANAETYLKQFFKVVDPDKTQVRWQSEWYGKFGLEEVLRLTSKFTVAQMLAREDFSKRMASGRPLAVSELLYPLLQAYDSVVIKADVEFGGVDQKFNCLVGRELQGMVGQRPQQVFLVPLLLGTDGSQKMSKSLGNYIGVTEPAEEMYGKVMSLPDSLILSYFELLTDVPQEEVEGFRSQMASASVNPMVIKKRLAEEIVAEFYDRKMAAEAEEHFIKVFQRKELPEEVQDYPVRKEEIALGYSLPGDGLQQLKMGGIEPESGIMVDVPRLLYQLGFAPSLSGGKRLITSGAVEIDGQRVTASPGKRHAWAVRDGSIIQVGKRRFGRLRILD